jgi:hypothetical protein
VTVLAVLLGQCTGAEATCELPRGLPWWFNLVFFAIWLTAVWGVVLLVRRRLARRRRERKSADPGTDLELW